MLYEVITNRVASALPDFLDELREAVDADAEES